MIMRTECHIDSKNPLCIDVPEQVKGLTLSILYALIAKALLTVVTFGIKLPGKWRWHLSTS